MYPAFVDMNEVESSKSLRMLELDAYSNMLAALRAQGPPTVDKLKLLKEIAAVLHIPQERCKAEIRKVVLDEKLNTIAYYTCGQVETTEDWIQEGRRLIPLLPRAAAETIYSAIADEVAEAASIQNEQLPLPAHTDRKRSISSSQGSISTPESSKTHQFKIPECLKSDDSNIKKRKLGLGIENSALAQHLIASSKLGRIQQIYRQKNKSKTKDHHMFLSSKPKPQEQDQQPRLLQTPYQTKMQQRCPLSIPSASTSSPKLNILQNISVPPQKKEEEPEEFLDENSSEEQQRLCESPQPVGSSENQTLKPLKQTLVNIKPNPNVTYKHVASPGPSSELPKSLKICSTRKHVTKTLPGQKLVIVSNAQSITNSSILQRTLTIPFKNISVKNLDKFKIVSTSTNPSNLQIASLTNSNANSASKHKVVTVKSNSATKKVIPLAHLHALNAKGSLKMFPIGSKLLSKTNAASPPAYVTSNLDGLLGTTSTASTSVIMTSRTQDSLNEKVDISENGEVHSVHEGDDAILQEAIENNGTSLIDDIESQITQLTAIPQTVPEKMLADEQVHEDFDNTESAERLKEVSNNHSSEFSTSPYGHTHDAEDKDLNSTAILSMNVDSSMEDHDADDSSSEIVLNNTSSIEQMTSNLTN